MLRLRWVLSCFLEFLRIVRQKRRKCSLWNSSPSLGKVGPVSHDYSAQHHVVFGEVTVEQISGSHHGHTEHIGHLHRYTQIHTYTQAFQDSLLLEPTNFIYSLDSEGSTAESLPVKTETCLCMWTGSEPELKSLFIFSLTHHHQSSELEFTPTNHTRSVC